MLVLGHGMCPRRIGVCPVEQAKGIFFIESSDRDLRCWQRGN